jgi:pimeloyl-ACP methyl ester carboxylesterase
MRILEHELPSSIVHATADTRALSRVVLWLGGTPHTGGLLAPVVHAAASLGRDVISVARPGYGGAPRRAGRSVADGIGEVVRVLDVLDLEDVVVVGFSGGGPHAIATGAARPHRVGGVLTFGCIAPFSADRDWFVGMADPSALKAAVQGIVARTAHPDDFEPSSFIDVDYEALDGPWSDLVTDTQAAHGYGDAGAVDDDMAFVRPWGFSLDDCTVPVALVHGARDRVVPAHHANVLSASLPAGNAIIHADDGHVSILRTLDAHLSGGRH